MMIGETPPSSAVIGFFSCGRFSRRRRAVAAAPRDPWVVYRASGAARSRAAAVALLKAYLDTRQLAGPRFEHGFNLVLRYPLRML